MYKFITTLLLGAGLATLLSTPANADAPQSVEQQKATVIFVRGEESNKTRSLNFNVYLGDNSAGRMKVKDTRTLQVPAGDYIVESNFYNSKSLAVSLEPGITYWISTTMEYKSNSNKARFELINSDMASSEQ
jgi:hypothetical protein